MAFVTADRTADTTTTVGTSPLVVSGTAPVGNRTFSAVMSVGDTCYYSVQHRTLNEWEVGLGTYSSANTLTRTTIYSSSNAGSSVTFSAGTKDVFITMGATRTLQLDAAGNVTPSIGGGSYTRTTFTATAGQTSFTATYTVNYVQVYVNGILLNSADYTATTGTTVVLATAASAGDIVDIIALNIGTFTSGGYTRTTYTATSGQTSFTAAYTPNYVQVYLNGVLLDPTDYTASSGTAVVLNTGAVAGDTVDIVALNIGGFTGGVTVTGTPASGQLTAWTGSSSIQGIDSYPIWQSVQTSNFTAVAGRAYPINTTAGAVTMTLPASPTAGQVIQIVDYAGTWATNNCTVNPNGNKINGQTSNVILKTSLMSVALVYVDSTRGWIAYSGFIANPTAYAVSYLIVAGGGGGGGAGGGGAGGYQTSTTSLSVGVAYTVTVGAGGAGAAGQAFQGVNGGNSVFNSVTSTGGGGGGAFSSTLQNGVSGGSGGGAGSSATSPYNTGAIGSGTSGQGNSGGLAVATGGSGFGGGGGASAVGGNGASNVGGTGGAGTASSITGSSVTYAGGGGGSGGATLGAGGTGGGGAGGQGVGSIAPVAGTANTGGGGGGIYTTNPGAAGGSGVVILSVPTANYSGTTTGSPTVTTSGSNTIIKFTSSGSYTA